jgi:hypothetical protein
MDPITIAVYGLIMFGMIGFLTVVGTFVGIFALFQLLRFFRYLMNKYNF